MTKRSLDPEMLAVLKDSVMAHPWCGSKARRAGEAARFQDKAAHGMLKYPNIARWLIPNRPGSPGRETRNASEPALLTSWWRSTAARAYRCSVRSTRAFGREFSAGIFHRARDS